MEVLKWRCSTQRQQDSTGRLGHVDCDEHLGWSPNANEINHILSFAHLARSVGHEMAWFFMCFVFHCMSKQKVCTTKLSSV